MGKIGLAGLGLLTTPVGILLAGSILFAHRHYPDVAQGFYSKLTMIGLLIAPLGAFYWFTVGYALEDRAGRPDEKPRAPWQILIAVYVAALVAIAVLVGSTSPSP